jgi:hypothetical protein
MSTSSHGGSREGSGRPRSAARALQDDKVVTKRLKGGAEVGWEHLSTQYISLMRRAVEIALGGDGITTSQSVSMLKSLLELMPKVVGAEADKDDSPMATLLREMRVKITATNDPD